MRVLITGASGFIGGALTVRLATEGIPVRAAHRASSDARALHQLGVERVVIDLSKPVSLKQAVRGCTHVIHLAAARGRPGISRAELATTNIAGTMALARAAAAEGADRFVFGSTVGVYGLVETSPADETTPLRPNTPYRQSKVDAENALRALEAETGLPVAIGRIGSTIGPGATNWIPLIRRIKQGTLRLLGNGANRIHPGHVDEMADALWRCAVRPEAAGETFVLAGAAALSFRTFTTLIADALGVPPPDPGPPARPYLLASRAASWVFQTSGVFVPWLHQREALVVDKSLSIEAARSRLGYLPTWTAADAIADMVGALGYRKGPSL